MKALTCEMCGSTNLIKQDGVFVCQQCGTKYSVEEAKKMMIEGTVSVQGTVSVDNSQKLENLYILGRRAIQNGSIDAIDYYKKILEIDPNSKEAIFMCDCFGIYENYEGSGSHLGFKGHMTSKHTTLFSDDEKKYFFSIVGRYYFPIKSYSMINSEIEHGTIDERIQEWGDCYKNEWQVIAYQCLPQIGQKHYEFLTDPFWKKPQEKELRLKNIRYGCQSFHNIVNKLKELNPSMDLQEYNEKITQMESDLHKLEQGIEPIQDLPQKESRASSASQEKSNNSKDKRETSFWLYCILAFFFVGGITCLAKSWPYDEDILSGNILCAISIFLSFIIYVIHKINQLPAKWHLIVMFILIGITAYFNYIDRKILYTIECPKCGHLVEKEARFKHIVDDEEYPTYCGRCDNDFMTLFTNCSFFCYPRPIGTYYNDVCRKNNENHERARREFLKEDEPQLTDNERKEQSSDVINSENQVECGDAFTCVPSSKHFYGGIDITGSKVIPFIYEWPFYFSEGLASVRKNGKCGYIDRSGKEIIPCIYINANPFSEGLASVQNANYEYGYIDKSGNSVIPFQYREAEPFSEGLAFVRKKDGDYSFIDKTGKEVLTSIYINDNSINFEILKDGYTDYGELLFFSEGLVCKRDFETNLNGYLDKNGREVIPCIYEYASKFSNGLALVRNSEWKYGYINKDGKLVISYQYDVAKSFSEGLAAVEISGKYGYIDKTGKAVIPFFYDYADSFVNGIAAVRKDNKIGFIDKEGTVIIPFLYNDYEIFSNGLIRVQNSEFKYGFIDKSGKEVIPFIYVYEEEIE